MTLKVVLASGNAGKLIELQHALEDLNFTLVPQSDYATPEAVEDGLTFVENALKKARNAAEHTQLAAIADDSGLVVPALGGAPGIYSARYSGEGDIGNNRKLLAAMKDLEPEQRSAWFFCAVIFLRHAEDPTPVIAEGRWHGSIALAPKGEQGFGYDPIFVPKSHPNCTAAQLSRDEKRRHSHRGQAVASLQAQLGT